jgi:hypothetical protein
VVPVFRNERVNSIPSKGALAEQQILDVVQALLKMTALPVPLPRKVSDYIAACNNVELLTALAAHQHPDIRCAVASNHYLPEDLVWKLAYDGNFTVRIRLAENHYLAGFLLETLAEDEDERIALRAMKSLERQSSNSDKFSNKVIHWMFNPFSTIKQTG